jgi:hypothetical protein
VSTSTTLPRATRLIQNAVSIAPKKGVVRSHGEAIRKQNVTTHTTPTQIQARVFLFTGIPFREALPKVEYSKGFTRPSSNSLLNSRHKTHRTAERGHYARCWLPSEAVGLTAYTDLRESRPGCGLRQQRRVHALLGRTMHAMDGAVCCNAMRYYTTSLSFGRRQIARWYTRGKIVYRHTR